MKKMWIKKESLYHKPFYKQKLKMTMLGVLLMGILFFAYQVFSVNQLQMSSTPQQQQQPQQTGSVPKRPAPAAQPRPQPSAPSLGRGIRASDLAAYAEPNGTGAGLFRCLRSGELISRTKLNDDYCDCADRTDEPATNACPEGVFYCAHVLRHPRAGLDRQTAIPNSRINDGICDCCDGSDEWLPQRKTGRTVHCVHRCV